MVICFIGLTGIVFFTLYFDYFDSGYIADFSVVFTAVCVGIISVLTVLTVLFYKINSGIVYKIFYLTIIFITIAILFIYIMQMTGFLDRFNTVEDFRSYISNFGNYAVLLFILIQFLQVVILPIPSFITVGAGVLLFGPLNSTIYSCVGIIAGSFVAFYIGRKFGSKVTRWIIGEQTLDKWLEIIRNKDKILLTFMILFPFFPDDVLCFVAGITSISWSFFCVMIVITRIVSISVSCFSMNNDIIPYNTWWGLLVWFIIILITVVLTFLICKKGDKLSCFFKNKNRK